MDRFKVREAKKRRDGHRLLDFRCWSGSEDFDPWVREVQEYIQLFALNTAYKVLLFETEDGALAGVSAFNKEDVALAGRMRRPGWRLEAIALGLAWQRKSVAADIEGCPDTMKASEYVLRATFQRMLELDRRRVVVAASVHDDNRVSMRACARVGLDRMNRLTPTDEYWPMIGEVDPAARPTAQGSTDSADH